MSLSTELWEKNKQKKNLNKKKTNKITLHSPANKSTKYCVFVMKNVMSFVCSRDNLLPEMVSRSKVN